MTKKLTRPKRDEIYASVRQIDRNGWVITVNRGFRTFDTKYARTEKRAVRKATRMLAWAKRKHDDLSEGFDLQ